MLEMVAIWVGEKEPTKLVLFREVGEAEVVEEKEATTTAHLVT